jgi:hypothetical protein
VRRHVHPGAQRDGRFLVLYVVGAAAAIVVAFGVLNATTVAATMPTEVRMDLSVSVRVDCRSNLLKGSYHSGSPDYHPSLANRASPVAQASAFAEMTGVTERFPGLSAEVFSTPSPRTTLVAFKEPGGTTRGALQYYGSRSDGWQLVHAWYC